MNSDEQMKNLSRAADWRAALIILKSAFAEDSRVWQHVNLNREEISFRKILDEGTFSSGERILLSVAASLFNREHSINLARSLIDSMKETPFWSLLRSARSLASMRRDS